MNRLINNRIFYLFVCLMICVNAKAQSSGYDCLGTLCTISVNVDTSATGLYLEYTVEAPDEEISYIQGPFAPKIVNNLGSTFDLWLMRTQIMAEAVDGNSVFYLELFVKKWSLGWGSYSTTDTSGAQCYYLITLIVTLI